MSKSLSGRFLYEWQLDALTSWLKCGRRGVIEAVTGSGKTDMALEAIADAKRRELFVMVVVPSRVLVEQWHGRLEQRFPEFTIGRLGDSKHDQPTDCDILVTTRHSASTHKPKPPTETGGLLIADECHGFGGGVLRRSLRPEFQERLGLTATLERSDDAVEKILLPYFGGVCYRYGFAEAIKDGVCAQPRVAFLAVDLNQKERDDYIAIEKQLIDARTVLRSIPDMPTAFGEFLSVVGYLAEKDAGPNGRAANDYLKAFSKRREIVASSTSKHEALGRLAPAIKGADGALIFTETVRASNHAVNRLDPYLEIELITGDTGRSARTAILDDLRSRRVDAVAAPRVLDEGIDVPNANLGIVVSASRTRRQMIQRMGRILRRKESGNGARFVIIFAADTLEDPRVREDRDGFLDEIESISESIHIFRQTEFDHITRFLDYTGPDDPVDPTRITSESVLSSGGAVWSDALVDEGDEILAERLIDYLGADRLYATLSYLCWPKPTWLHQWSWENFEVADHAASDYLQLDEIVLPKLSKAKPKKKVLSTGERPLVMVGVGKEFALRCTGCGVTSTPTPFKYQVREQTVDCACEPDY